MPRANEPFEDPEFLAELARLGITHRPGLAAEMMQQFEPLLMADGIDLNDPNAAFSGDELQAALDRATERHNLELVTPIGHRRELAAGLLRAFAVALAEGRDEDAQSLLQFASPDGGEDHPTIAHVIGVGIGLLDTWFSDAEVLPVIGAAQHRSGADPLARRRRICSPLPPRTGHSRRSTASSCGPAASCCRKPQHSPSRHAFSR